jgi:hypothetical protein
MSLNEFRASNKHKTCYNVGVHGEYGMITQEIVELL